MRRDPTPYAEFPIVVAQDGYGLRIDAEPVAGFYRFRLRSGGVPVGIRIWYGAPHDPETGELMDRSYRWQAHCNGDYIDFERVWPYCYTEQITEIDYNRHCAKQMWAQKNAPDDALANPHHKVDHLSTPLLF
jgi:hypothetical protein